MRGGKGEIGVPDLVSAEAMMAAAVDYEDEDYVSAVSSVSDPSSSGFEADSFIVEFAIKLARKGSQSSLCLLLCLLLAH